MAGSSALRVAREMDGTHAVSSLLGSVTAGLYFSVHMHIYLSISSPWSLCNQFVDVKL